MISTSTIAFSLAHLCGRRKLLGYKAGMTQPLMGRSDAIFMGLSTGLCGKKEYVWYYGILQMCQTF